MEGYKYYSTQRPVDIGTYPKPTGNLPVEIVNYDVDSCIPVEGWKTETTAPTWGEIGEIFMKLIDAATERFEAVEILGIPGLFTTRRIDRATVPKGMYAYDLQTLAEDWGQPCVVARYIARDYFGTVLTASPIDLPEGGHRELTASDFDQGSGSERLTVAEFEARYLPPVPRHKAFLPDKNMRRYRYAAQQF